MANPRLQAVDGVHAEDMSLVDVAPGVRRMFYACCDREGNWGVTSATCSGRRPNPFHGHRYRRLQPQFYFVFNALYDQILSRKAAFTTMQRYLIAPSTLLSAGGTEVNPWLLSRAATSAPPTPLCF